MNEQEKLNKAKEALKVISEMLEVVNINGNEEIAKLMTVKSLAKHCLQEII